ncbi:M13 family metallopeptidase [Clostridium sp. BJN0001]|uniref:M13 family metallopeptidase n=1 Tax=Clostridium sp. BJN0001 TaxID=2930219 RepID=UPI001FD35169|nr:M13 family metallopeptidase [Clostridium sp. BJN0001]
MKYIQKIISMLLILVLLVANTFSIGVYGYEKTRVQDDFYEAINGEWISNNSLTRGQVCYGTFEQAAMNVNENLIEIVENIKANRNKFDKNSSEIKLLNLYENCLNIDERNNQGIKPVKKYVDKVKAAQNTEELKDIIYSMDYFCFPNIINLQIAADYKNSNKNVIYICRNFTGLGNSLYYNDESEKIKKIQEIYITYIRNLHKLIGENEKVSMNNADKYYETEKNLIKDVPTKADQIANEKNMDQMYNIFSKRKLDKKYNNIEFNKIFKNLNVKKTDKIVVEDPMQLEKVNLLMENENLDEVKNYIITGILISADDYLNNDIKKVKSDLVKALYGIEISDISRNDALKLINCKLSGIMSRLYIKNYFDEESKIDIQNMAFEIISNYKKRIKNNTWLSDRTKKKAIKKLNKINVKIGYPDKWKDYSDLSIQSYKDGGCLLENILNIEKWYQQDQLKKLTNPVDKSEWNMNTYEVNAYYNSQNNEIVFPAGILQKPFYDINGEKEKNLGGIGVIIGHELTHAFDNTGSKFDENGNRKDWWSKKDYKKFKEKARKIEEYYSNIKMNNGKNVNGVLTVGENISDLGGMACILDIADKDKDKLKLLFENYAVIWRGISTDGFERYLLENDLHSPKKVRVNAVVSQFKEFYEVYDVKEGDKMYIPEEKRVLLW